MKPLTPTTRRLNSTFALDGCTAIWALLMPTKGNLPKQSRYMKRASSCSTMTKIKLFPGAGWAKSAAYSAPQEALEQRTPGVMQSVEHAPSSCPDLLENVLQEPQVVESPVEESNPLPEMMMDPVIEPAQAEEATSERPSTEIML